MKKIFIITAAFLFSLNTKAQLLSQDFESEAANTNVTTTVGSLYQIDNTDTDCGASDGWRIYTADASGTSCSGCSGNRGVIDYGPSSCAQDATLISGTFTPGCGTTIDISFNYAFDNEDSPGAEFFIADLYNETDGVVEANLVNTSTDVDNGFYSSSVGFTSGKTYSLRFQYIADYDWGATVDNILVTEAGPTVGFTQNCASDLSYTVTVVVSSLAGGSSVDITNGGGTTYFSSVGLGTYTVSGLSAAETIEVENNLGCVTSQTFAVCDVCSLSSTPSDECATANAVNLNSIFYGSTDCSYTPSTGSPSGCGSIENDSWMEFTATSDSVSIDWDITGGVDCIGTNNTSDADPGGIQLSVWSGSCGSLSILSGSCTNPTGGIGYSGTWDFSGMTVGNTYYIRIDGYAGDQCEYTFDPGQGVAVIPSNGECADATVLACGDRDTASIILATDTDKPTGCGGMTTGKGNWYVISGSGADITLSTDNSGTNFGTEIHVYSGTCGSLTCVASDDDSGTTLSNASVVTFNAANGTDYYVYIDGDGTAQGQYELSVSCTSCPADAGTWN